MNAQVKPKQPTLVVLNLTQLELSQTPIQIERRAQFDQAALKELSATIAAVGRPEQPIVVRPAYSIKNGDHYEVVDGERRVLATEMAELGEILAEVRDLTDDQVEKIQIITGVQKEGLHELVEAEGYEQLKKRGLSVEEIAAKCGKSPGTVYARMKLLALSPECRKAFREKTIDASVALLIARIPGDEQQARALKFATELNWNHEPPRYREVAKFVHETFMLKLSEAPFPREDETLVEGAGPCSKCPMRTGNNPDLFGDVKGADVCTNPPCFQAKKKAHIKRELEKAKATGETVIRGADAKRILPDRRYYGWGEDSKQLRNGYARPSDKCLDDPKKRTYAELAGKDAPKVLLQDPNSGRVSKVFKIEDIADRLKAKGIKPKPPAEDREEARAQDREREEQSRKVELQARAAIFQAIVAAAPTKLAREDLVALLGLATNIGYGDDEEFYAVLGWPAPKRKGRSSRDVFQEKLLSCTDAELAQLAVALPAIEDAMSTYDKPTELEALAKRFGVDVKRIRAEAAPPAPEPKPKAKAKSKKKAARKPK